MVRDARHFIAPFADGLASLGLLGRAALLTMKV